MCGFPCYHHPTNDILKLFKTGRKDCQPKAGVPDEHRYLTDKLEIHPDANESGVPTFNYFKKVFRMGPRESLALLGIHTIGQFNGMSAHLNYGWTTAAGEKMKLFNNEYFRNMAESFNCDGMERKRHNFKKLKNYAKC